MLTQFNARTRNLLDQSVNQEIDFPLGSGVYNVTDIEGLGPVDTTINSVANAADPGVSIASTTDGSRNIVVTLGFNPEYGSGQSMSSLRRALNKVFTPGMSIEMDFIDSELGTYRIWGVVEKNDPTVFTLTPSTQISIVCANPYFVEVDTNGDIVTQTIEATIATFDLTPYGYSEFLQAFEITNPLDLPVGMKLSFTLGSMSSVQGINITNVVSVTDDEGSPSLNGPSIGITASGTLFTEAYMTIIIDSIAGERGISYAHPTGSGSLMAEFSFGELTPFVLYPGKNQFMFSFTQGQSFDVTAASATFTPIYDGM